MILDTRLFNEFQPWANRLTQLLAPFGSVPQPTEDWRKWGASLSLLPGISGQTQPSPYRFDNWKDWARKFNLVTELPPPFKWLTIPNQSATGSYSVNILTSFCAPAGGVTLTLQGTLPTGWAFDGTNLTHTGATPAGPATVSFLAVYGGIAWPSNSFTVTGT